MFHMRKYLALYLAALVMSLGCSGPQVKTRIVSAAGPDKSGINEARNDAGGNADITTSTTEQEGKSSLPESTAQQMAPEEESQMQPDPAFSLSALKFPLCAYNAAYSLNGEPDKISAILAEAKGCYVLIDPFKSNEARSAIAKMKAAGNIVACYMSSGTCESSREDFGSIKKYCSSVPVGADRAEYFVSDAGENLVEQMKKRIDSMKSWGCQMVEFDNMDFAFDESNIKQYGLKVTASQAEEYNGKLCDHAHAKEMGCMAKNTTQGADQFDGVTFESYFNQLDWWEPNQLKIFMEQKKIGLVVHYNEAHCSAVYDGYKSNYSSAVSFICQDKSQKTYQHFN